MKKNPICSFLFLLVFLPFFGCLPVEATITCGFPPNSTVIVDTGQTQIFGRTDANGCIRHQRGSVVRPIRPTPAQN